MVKAKRFSTQLSNLCYCLDPERAARCYSQKKPGVGCSSAVVCTGPITHPPKSSPKTHYRAQPDNLLAGLETAGESLLGHVVLDGTLLGSSALSEGNGTTEGASQGGVLETGNADVLSSTDRSLAGHTGGHLDSDREVHDGGGRKTTDSDTGNVGGDIGALESGGVSATGGSIDVGGERTSTVLVDLVEGHGKGAVIGSGGHTAGSGTGSSLDTSLAGTLGGLGTTASSTDGELGVASLVLEVDGTSGLGCSGVTTNTVHEGGDHCGGADGTTTVGTAKGGSLGSSELGAANDGSVGLRATGGSSTVTRSAVGNRETGQVDTVGTLDLGDDTVGKDAGSSEGGNEDGGRVLHFD